MKRQLRPLAALLAVCLLCTAFSGCTQIDSLREARAYPQVDGSIDYAGHRYLLLPDCDDLNPGISSFRPITVAQKDIPLLLGSSFGQRAFYSQDGLFLENNGNIYCREDRYQVLCDRIKNQEYFEAYGYTYNEFDENGDVTLRRAVSTDEQTLAIAAVYDSVSPADEDPALLEVYWIASLEYCSKDGLFSAEIGGLYHTGQAYYLSGQDAAGNLHLYRVPADLELTIAAFAGPAIRFNREYGYTGTVATDEFF